MSLYGDPGLNPSVIPSVKLSEKIHVITPLQLFKNLYNPSAIWSVYTDEILLSVYIDHIADGNGLSVYIDKIRDGIMSISKITNEKILLVFADFLVVLIKKYIWKETYNCIFY